MSVDIQPSVRSEQTAVPRRRDGAIDLARAWCLTLVVVLHALMVGVWIGAHGPVLQNALEGWAGFAPFTWLVQIMPLFFVIGGFSAFTQWTALRGRGTTSSEYVGMRMRRLLRPAVAAIGAVVIVLAVLSILHVPADIVTVAGFRLSQPLWFLGVYALTTSLVPAMVAAHRRAPIATVCALALAVVAVDIVRASTGVAAVGYLNLGFVWLLVQQLGFWLADGRMPRCRVRQWMLAVGSFGTLALLCTTGAYSFDLLADLNPPCGALVLLGIGQLAMFDLARPALRRMDAARVVHGISTWINARAMTIYLWHMLVLVLLAGVLLLTSDRLPVPLDAAWWTTRPIWLASVITAVALVTRAAGRWEVKPTPTLNAERRTGPLTALVSTALAIGGVVILLATGITVVGGVVGLACIGTALAAVMPRPDDSDVLVPRLSPAAASAAE
ncbi:acyltransferase [Humibacter ginsengiterrae]